MKHVPARPVDRKVMTRTSTAN